SDAAPGKMRENRPMVMATSAIASQQMMKMNGAEKPACETIKGATPSAPSSGPIAASDMANAPQNPIALVLSPTSPPCGGAPVPVPPDRSGDAPEITPLSAITLLVVITS